MTSISMISNNDKIITFYNVYYKDMIIISI